MLKTNLVTVELSTQHIIFTPSDAQDFAREGDISAPDLEITVVNTSQRFASFQLALYAQGQRQHTDTQWYQVEPNVCAKKPPGDRTTFFVNLLKAPIPAYDSTVPVTLEILSAELAELAVTETIYVQILRPHKTLRVYLPVQDLSVYPGSRLRIPVLLYNLEPQPREIDLRLKGADLDWFPDGIEQTLVIEAGNSREVSYWCAPAAIPQNLHGMRTITVEATDRDGNSASAGSYLEILPFGQTRFEVPAPQQTIPAQPHRWQTRAETAIFPCSLHNQSNLDQHIELQVEPQAQQPDQAESNNLTLAPGEHTDTTLAIHTNRPWLGWTRTRFFEAIPRLRYIGSGEIITALTPQPASQMLTLKVKPVVPFWVQLLTATVGLLGLWWLWLLSPRAVHTAPVNSVVLLANGDTVVSGSRDQTVRRWQVSRAAWLPDVRRLREIGQLAEPNRPETQFDRAIRVVEQQPANVKRVAVGLDSGEVQLWAIDPPRQLDSFFEKSKLDRVFDVAFTQDSRQLFTGHGSGTVRQWSVDSGQPSVPKKLYLSYPKAMPAAGQPPDRSVSSAITALDVIEPPGQSGLVAIAGQFNRLALWNWETRQAYDIVYEWTDPEADILPVTSRHSYLTSLDVADDAALMATADSVGFITLWDVAVLRDCLNTAKLTPDRATIGEFGNRFFIVDCSSAQIDQWQAGRQGSAIRSVALTDNGCYLASTGDSGRISLWPIAATGERHRASPIGLASFPNTSLNSIDIHLTTDNVVLVATDTPGQQLQVYRKQLNSHGCQ